MYTARIDTKIVKSNDDYKFAKNRVLIDTNLGNEMHSNIKKTKTYALKIC